MTLNQSTANQCIHTLPNPYLRFSLTHEHIYTRALLLYDDEYGLIVTLSVYTCLSIYLSVYLSTFVASRCCPFIFVLCLSLSLSRYIGISSLSLCCDNPISLSLPPSI